MLPKFLRKIGAELVATKRISSKRPAASRSWASQDPFPFGPHQTSNPPETTPSPVVAVSSLGNVFHALAEAPTTSDGRGNELTLLLRRPNGILDVVERIYDEIFELDPEPTSLSAPPGSHRSLAARSVGDLSQIVAWLNAPREPADPNRRRVLRINGASAGAPKTGHWLPKWQPGATYAIDDSLLKCLIQIFVEATVRAPFTLAIDAVSAPPQLLAEYGGGYRHRNYRTGEMLQIDYRTNKDGLGTLYVRRYLPVVI